MISTKPGFTRSTAPGSFPDHRAILEAIYELAGRGSAVDLGCGAAHVTKNWDAGTVLVDQVIQSNPRLPVCQMDILDYPMKHSDKRHTLLVMTDVIEHLHDMDGRRLLSQMDRICDAMAIFTPSGPFKMDVAATDPDSHKSAWYPEQFWLAGWEVWEWPAYHRFEGGQILGAFWAWRFKTTATPPVEAVAQMAGIDLIA